MSYASYGYGQSCARCGGTPTGESHRGFVGRCTCNRPPAPAPAESKNPPPVGHRQATSKGR